MYHYIDVHSTWMESIFISSVKTSTGTTLPHLLETGTDITWLITLFFGFFFFFTMWTTLGTSCIHCFIHHNKITSIMQVTVFYLSFSMVLDLINKSKKWHLEKCCWRGKTCIAILFWLRMIFETISTILHQREVLLPFRLQTIKNLMLN